MMTRKILRDIIFEIFLLHGLAWLVLWLYLVWSGKINHPVPSGSIGISALIIWWHLPYTFWRKLGVVLTYILLMTGSLALFFPQGWLWPSWYFLAFGIIQLVTVVWLWFFQPDKPRLSWRKRAYD